LFYHNTYAQEVNISREINVRNDYAYDVFYFDNKIYFYRDKGFEYFLDVFDKDLKYKRTQEIKPEDKKVFIESIHSIDSTLIIYYTFKDKDKWILRAKKYSGDLSPIDTLDILISDKSIDAGEMKSVLSDDKSHILLFNINKSKIRSLLLNTKYLDVVTDAEFELPDYKAREDFIEVTISNNGDIFYLFEKNNDEWEREDHMMRLLCYIKNVAFFKDVDFREYINSGTKISYDNKNQRLCFAGLWGKKNTNEQHGYFIFNKSIQELFNLDTQPIDKYLFDENIVFDLEGIQKKNQKNYLYDFYIKEIVHRQDGGIILITELQRELIRRTGNLTSFDRAALSRGYIDYYNEDMIVWSANIDGSISWRTILFKKQFSQDDEGIYSSFFIMKIPSQMHIVFNDEIKNNSTVSEYVLDPLGNFTRNSLLSTEYKNLKLRFSDAQQLSSNEFIVPSEKNGKINLVKVLY
jgi:hypothetical protein